MRLRHLRMQKIRQEKLFKFQAIRRKAAFNQLNDLNGYNNNNQAKNKHSIMNSLNENVKLDGGIDEQFSSKSDQSINEKANGNGGINKCSSSHNGNINNNNNNTNEISSNIIDTSESNKINNEPFNDKNYSSNNSNIACTNDNDEILSSENEFNYYDSNMGTVKTNHLNANNQNNNNNTSNSYQNLSKYYNDLQHYNNSNYDEDDCDDSIILNDNDSNENEDFNLDDIIRNDTQNNQSASKKRKINFSNSRPQTNINSNNNNNNNTLQNVNNTTTNTTATTTAPKSQFECVVCADVAFGNRYGCWVCEGCKEFFRRQREKNTAEISQCVNGTNKCEINVNTRSVCKRCRFDKCLKAGMKLVGKYNSGRGTEPNKLV